MPKTCHYCNQESNFPRNPAKGRQVELRPYGPGGADVCFQCMTKSPEREAAAHKVFGAQLDAANAGGQGVSTLTSDGPEPGLQPPPESQSLVESDPE